MVISYLGLLFFSTQKGFVSLAAWSAIISHFCQGKSSGTNMAAKTPGVSKDWRAHS